MQHGTPPPTAGRRERKRLQTADLLADVAWSMFQQQGFEAVTMEAIADGADVAKGTLYKHFPVKEALLGHILHRELAQRLPALLTQLSALPTVKEQLFALFRHSAQWSEAHREHLRHYVLYRMREVGAAPAEPHQRSGMETLLLHFVRAGQASGELRPERDDRQLVHYLQFMHLGALLRWLHVPEVDLQAEMAATLTLFLHGAGVTP